MLTNIRETRQALAYIDMAREQLLERRFQANQAVPIGGMIEVPAAALSLPHFLNYLDYVSIGTNDLIQYTLAVDRVDHQVAHLYDPTPPGRAAAGVRGHLQCRKSRRTRERMW